MSVLRKTSEVDLEDMDRNTLMSMMRGAMWDLLEILEKSDGPFLRRHTNSCDVIPKIRELMSILEQYTEVNPATTAMSNDIILAEVLKHTDVTDLHHFRVVNRKWNYFATQILSQQKSLKISFNASVLENLSSVNWNGFVISTIELDVDDWKKCIRYQAFLLKHGPHVRTICLIGRKPQELNYFVDVLNWLLNTCFTHVENLICEWDFRDNSVYKPCLALHYPHNVVLPSLKHLCIKSSKIPGYLLPTLIRSAVSLERVQVSNALSQQLLVVLVAENRIELLKEYILFTDTWRVPVSAWLASKNPVLECLEVRQYHPRIPTFVQSLAQILTSSRVTLTSLTVYAFNFISESNIDTFPNLKHLHLYNNENCGPISAIFPNGTILSIMFPRLESLVLAGLILQKNEMIIYFPGDVYESRHVDDPWGEVTNVQLDTHMTVKFFELEDCSLTKFGLNALAKKFPNVRSVLFQNSKDFLKEETLWYLPWEKLEYLELGRLVLGKLIMSSSLDSIFTGFSEETCKKLRADRGKTDFVVDLEALTEYPSIRELKNLQKLKLVFDILNQPASGGAATSGGENSAASEVLGFSWLTGRFAFEEMPKLLRVVIAYDKKHSNSADLIGALESVASFGGVTLVHEPRKP